MIYVLCMLFYRLTSGNRNKFGMALDYFVNHYPVMNKAQAESSLAAIEEGRKVSLHDYILILSMLICIL